mgnify:FL=1
MMRRLLPKRGVLATMFAMLLIAVWFIQLPASAASTAHTLTLDMRQFEFTPGRFEVQQGDTVTILLTASDVVHGFYLDGYGIEQRVEPGISQQISFTADQAGKFRYRCAVSCGTLHPFMIGELVVNTNFPFWRALAMLGVSLIGSLVYLSFGAKQS